MAYKSLEACLLDLEKIGQLARITEEVDPWLEMAAIHLRVHESKGPALLFENVKGTRFRAASNIFGTIERSKYIFRDTLKLVQQLIAFKNEPLNALRHPFENLEIGLAALKAFPLKILPGKSLLSQQIPVSELPAIQHWIKDGGPFVTLPQVYTEDPEHPGIRQSNLGMYRVQLSGNQYELNKEVGLHYQLHRGIGVHQTKAIRKGFPLKVSVFIGGPPAHTVAAVMPLPEGISELKFAGILGGRRFRYIYADGYCISTDADFVITGELMPGDNKPEGPFGDHLGYYSLVHPFPVMKVHKIFAKRNAIWPFTVVGRPPQEDTSFGKLIHEITGDALQKEIPGLKEVHAVDAAGVHPLLLAIGSERYTPYAPVTQPAEILTIANHILGTGQLSLAKFLFITADETGNLTSADIAAFFRFVLERINPARDIHFLTNTTIDTLDYSGLSLNNGSKVIFAACGPVKRRLFESVPEVLNIQDEFGRARMVLPGIVALETKPFTDYASASAGMELLSQMLRPSMNALNGIVFIIICDDSGFVAGNMRNFIWTTFTRCNPSHDIYGIESFTEHKHWGCKGPVLFDARAKPHHAPALVKDPVTEKKIDRLFEKGGSLYAYG